MTAYARLLEDLAEAAREAGEAIQQIVRRGFDVETKQDSSPVTEADRAAELIILAALARAAPGVPVIARYVKRRMTHPDSPATSEPIRMPIFTSSSSLRSQSPAGE